MKFGIWRTRYGMRGFFEGWVFIDGKPAVFNSEDNAVEYMHKLEKLSEDDYSIEYSVRKYMEGI